MRLTSLLASLFTVEIMIAIRPLVCRALMTCVVICPTSVVLVIEDFLHPRIIKVMGESSPAEYYCNEGIVGCGLSLPVIGP